MRASLRRSLIRHIPPRLHPYLRSAQFGVTPMIGSVLRRLPGTSREFGPPRDMAPTLAAYVERARHDHKRASYRPWRPAEMITRVEPRSAEPETHFEFFNEISRLSPPVGVATLEQGRVLARTGAVIGADDCLIADVSDPFFLPDPAAHPIFLSAKLPRVTRSDETVAVLTTFRSDIYYHWLLDTLPRLHLLRESGISYDKIIIPCQSAFQRESLDLLGVDRARLITERGLHLEAATLVVPSLPGVVGNPPRWVCDFLRRSFLPLLGERGPSHRRLYIGRGKGATRHIINEPELLALLRKRGFDIVFPETLSFLEQVRLFDEAALVVAPHGSGLTNLVFCRAGTQIVELFSPNYVTVPYWALSNQIGLDYAYVMGEGGWDPARGRGRTTHDNILLDIAKLEAVLDDIEQRSKPSAPSVAIDGCAAGPA